MNNAKFNSTFYFERNGIVYHRSCLYKGHEATVLNAHHPFNTWVVIKYVSDAPDDLWGIIVPFEALELIEAKQYNTVTA